MASVHLETLKKHLKELKLYAILNSFEEEAEKSAKLNLSYVEFLANLIIQREILDKTDHSINRKINLARFPRLATLEEFDFSFQPSLNAKETKELANLGFIEKKENIIFLGPPDPTT